MSAKWIPLALCVALGWSCGDCAVAAEEAGSHASRVRHATRPNLLLILCDDLGFSDLGCYGGEIHTPHLDRLAAGGLRFTQFYNGARCCPSRASLMTGLYPHQAGVGDMTGDAGAAFPGYRGHLGDQCLTIAQALRLAGYRTFLSGKWHLGRPGPIARGFEEYFGFANLAAYGVDCWKESDFGRLPAGRKPRTYPAGTFYATDAITDHALDFLAEARRTPDKPWFLYLAYNAPHFPLQAPREEIDKYATLYERGWDRIREQRHARQKTLDMPGSWTLTPRSAVPVTGYARQTRWAGKENPAWESLDGPRRTDLARRMAIYAAMVDRMDAGIGRVLQDLEGRGELDRTLILFLSDNGACAEWDPWGFDIRSGPENTLHTGDALKSMGSPGTYHSYGSGWANACNTPFRLYKHYGHEGGIATPLIVHWPAGISAKGQWRQQAGHIIDVMPTFLQVAGASYPAEHAGHRLTPLEGKSLVPTFADGPLDREYLAWEHEGNRAIRQGNWKLVSIKDQPWELYDLAADRTELQDLALQQSERVRQMAAKWETWAQRAHVLPRP